jgi:hypothetical protein
MNQMLDGARKCAAAVPRLVSRYNGQVSFNRSRRVFNVRLAVIRPVTGLRAGHHCARNRKGSAQSVFR